MPSKYTHVNGHAILYYYAGATTLPDVVPDFSRGRRILFLHAAGSNGHSWHHQIDHLAGAHSPLAPDLPGHGRSSGVEGMGSVAEYTDFVVRFMDALEMKSAVIAGRSMGGAIAMDLAVRHPGRVEALVLIATAAKFNLAQERVDGFRAVAMGRASQAFGTDGYAPKTIKENFGAIREGWMEQIRTDPRVRYTDIKVCTEVDLRDSIGKIDRPTLILAGTDDASTPVKDSELIREKIRGARLEVLADAAHNIPTERPDQVNAATEKFLSELR